MGGLYVVLCDHLVHIVALRVRTAALLMLDAMQISFRTLRRSGDSLLADFKKCRYTGFCGLNEKVT